MEIVERFRAQLNQERERRLELLKAVENDKQQLSLLKQRANEDLQRQRIQQLGPPQWRPPKMTGLLPQHAIPTDIPPSQRPSDPPRSPAARYVPPAFSHAGSSAFPLPPQASPPSRNQPSPSVNSTASFSLSPSSVASGGHTPPATPPKPPMSPAPMSPRPRLESSADPILVHDTDSHGTSWVSKDEKSKVEVSQLSNCSSEESHQPLPSTDTAVRPAIIMPRVPSSGTTTSEDFSFKPVRAPPPRPPPKPEAPKSVDPATHQSTGDMALDELLARLAAIEEQVKNDSSMMESESDDYDTSEMLGSAPLTFTDATDCTTQPCALPASNSSHVALIGGSSDGTFLSGMGNTMASNGTCRIHSPRADATVASMKDTLATGGYPTLSQREIHQKAPDSPQANAKSSPPRSLPSNHFKEDLHSWMETYHLQGQDSVPQFGASAVIAASSTSQGPIERSKWQMSPLRAPVDLSRSPFVMSPRPSSSAFTPPDVSDWVQPRIAPRRNEQTNGHMVSSRDVSPLRHTVPSRRPVSVQRPSPPPPPARQRALEYSSMQQKVARLSAQRRRMSQPIAASVSSSSTASSDVEPWLDRPRRLLMARVPRANTQRQSPSPVQPTTSTPQSASAPRQTRLGDSASELEALAAQLLKIRRPSPVRREVRIPSPPSSPEAKALIWSDSEKGTPAVIPDARTLKQRAVAAKQALDKERQEIAMMLEEKRQRAFQKRDERLQSFKDKWTQRQASPRRTELTSTQPLPSPKPPREAERRHSAPPTPATPKVRIVDPREPVAETGRPPPKPSPSSLAHSPEKAHPPLADPSLHKPPLTNSGPSRSTSSPRRSRSPPTQATGPIKPTVNHTTASAATKSAIPKMAPQSNEGQPHSTALSSNGHNRQPRPPARAMRSSAIPLLNSSSSPATHLPTEPPDMSDGSPGVRVVMSRPPLSLHSPVSSSSPASSSQHSQVTPRIRSSGSRGGSPASVRTTPDKVDITRSPSPPKPLSPPKPTPQIGKQPGHHSPVPRGPSPLRREYAPEYVALTPEMIAVLGKKPLSERHGSPRQ